MEVHDIIQEVVIKTIPKKKKWTKAKWLSEEALQIAQKRREAKGKGEKKRYIHLNAVFQRIARRAFIQMFKLVLEKAEEPEIKLPTAAGSSKKQESSRKTSISALLTMPKPLTAWITINCGKFWKRWEYQTTWSAYWEICIQVRKQQLELDMEQQTGSK